MIRWHLLPLLCLALVATACDSPDGTGSNGRCGDGLRASGEECDDGNAIDDDECTNACTTATCGDGIARTDLGEGVIGSEACDDGNDFDGDSCLTNCSLAVCGDGILRTDVPEGEEATMTRIG